MKYTIISVTAPFDIYESLYCDYLLDKVESYFPDMLSEEDIKHLKARIEQVREGQEKLDEEEEVAEDQPNTTEEIAQRIDPYLIVPGNDELH